MCKWKSQKVIQKLKEIKSFVFDETVRMVSLRLLSEHNVQTAVGFEALRALWR